MIRICKHGHLTGFRNCPLCSTTPVSWFKRENQHAPIAPLTAAHEDAREHSLPSRSIYPWWLIGWLLVLAAITSGLIWFYITLQGGK